MSVGTAPWFYPRRYIRIADVTSTAQPVFAAATRVRFSHAVIANTTAGAEVVTIRAIDNSPDVLTLNMAAGATLVIPGWQTDTEGLEILTASDNTGVHATFFYGVGPLGAS